MRYGIGETLADNGFGLLEKLHSPMFLVHKNGTLKNINEAGRKLLRIAHLSVSQVETLVRSCAAVKLGPGRAEQHRIDTKNKHIKIITKQLGSSDYILVELHRLA